MSRADSPPSPAQLRLAGRTPEHWLALALSLGALGGLLLLGTIIAPDERGFGTHERLGLPPCQMMRWTGIPCPGCGVTTSVALAAHGRFWESFSNQPFGFVATFLVGGVAAGALVLASLGRDLGTTARALRWRRGGLVLLGLFVVSWLYKIVRTAA